MKVGARIAASVLAAGLAISVPVSAAVAGPVVAGRQGAVRVITNGCTGEELTFIGMYSYVTKQNGDGTYTSIYSFHATAGDQYIWKQTRKSVYAGGFELQGDDHGLLISKGDAPTAVATFHFDFTVSPVLWDFRLECRG